MTIDLYKKSEFEDKMSELELIKDRSSDEYFFKYMKIIISFGKEDRLTDYGYQRGKELYTRWKKGEELKREEMMNLGLLLSDICIIDQDYTIQSDITKNIQSNNNKIQARPRLYARDIEIIC